MFFSPINFLAQIPSFLFISLSPKVTASHFETVTYPENEGVSSAFQLEKEKKIKTWNVIEKCEETY